MPQNSLKQTQLLLLFIFSYELEQGRRTQCELSLHLSSLAVTAAQTPCPCPASHPAASPAITSRFPWENWQKRAQRRNFTASTGPSIAFKSAPGSLVRGFYGDTALSWQHFVLRANSVYVCRSGQSALSVWSNPGFPWIHPAELQAQSKETAALPSNSCRI